MKRRPKIYPEHLCLSCSRMTTNRSYCDTCMGMMMKPAYTPPELKITAPKGPTIWRRREDINREVGA